MILLFPPMMEYTVRPPTYVVPLVASGCRVYNYLDVAYLLDCPHIPDDIDVNRFPVAAMKYDPSSDIVVTSIRLASAYCVTDSISGMAFCTRGTTHGIPVRISKSMARAIYTFAGNNALRNTVGVLLDVLRNAGYMR